MEEDGRGMFGSIGETIHNNKNQFVSRKDSLIGSVYELVLQQIRKPTAFECGDEAVWEQ